MHSLKKQLGVTWLNSLFCWECEPWYWLNTISRGTVCCLDMLSQGYTYYNNVILTPIHTKLIDLNCTKYKVVFQSMLFLALPLCLCKLPNAKEPLYSRSTCKPLSDTLTWIRSMETLPSFMRVMAMGKNSAITMRTELNSDRQVKTFWAVKVSPVNT